MSFNKKFPEAASRYKRGNTDATHALISMTSEMNAMGREHSNFHKNFSDVQKRIQAMKEEYGGNELDVEVVRAAALDRYLSEDNLPKVTALGHYEMEKTLNSFQLQEKQLAELQKKTAELVDSLLSDNHCKSEDRHRARA